MGKRILLATGQEKIDDAVKRFEEYEIVGSIVYRKDFEEAVGYFAPDIILVTDGLTGHEVLFELIIKVKQKNPKVRIIYLAGQLDDKDIDKYNRLGTLVLSGIYDISHEKQLSLAYLKNLIDKPKREEQVSYLTKYLKNSKKEKEPSLVEIEMPVEEVEDTEKDGYKNIFAVSSIKPGTGKSFIATNLATAIAKYGKKKPNGERPKVALIEADLQNLSVGTLLGIEDDKKNLKTVMEKIATIITKDENLIDDVQKIEETNEFVRSCFKPYEFVKNLEALVGSQFSMEEVENFNALYYIYLIESIKDFYDVVIVDSNSSLVHTTTYPILNLANTCYYVLNLDFNNVRNNVRYKETLHNIGILDRVKYILNEDIDESGEDYNDMNGTSAEKLIFTSESLDKDEFPLVAKIPAIKKSIFLNRLFEGKPIVLDETEYTLKARHEIAKIANEIWELENIKELEEEVNKKNQERTSRKKKKLGFFK